MKQIDTWFIMSFLSCAIPFCLAQETYHNEEFEFTISIPSKWHISFENEWSEEVKAVLRQRYFSETLFMLNPLGIKAPDAPCIIAFGQKIEGMTTSEAIAFIKKTDKKAVATVEEMAEELLMEKIKDYRKIDTFYDFDSSRNLALARILYKHNNEENTYFMVVLAKFIGVQRDVTFRVYWKGSHTEKFKAILDGIINSFEFDQDAKPKGMLGAIPQEIKETVDLPKEHKFDRILKWSITILGILIILGIVKTLLER